MKISDLAYYGLPLLAAMGFAPDASVQAGSIASPAVMTLVDDEEDDAQLWDEMYWLMEALLWLLKQVEEEQALPAYQAMALKTEADVIALANTEILAWDTNGLKPGLSAPQMAQGVVDCDKVLAFIAAHPGMLSASLEGEYVSTVQAIRAALLN